MGSTLNCPPFSKVHQLCDELDLYEPEITTATALPGQPCLRLDDTVHITDFLDKEFCSHDLEEMAPHLWIMSTQSSANINTLHHQRIKGREIIVTEQPRLHLVWIHDRIFIKPLPRYLLSHQFWEVFLSSKSTRLGNRRDSIRRAATGYLRTYRFLVQHESDFVIAQQDHLRLIPQDVQWTDFCWFMSEFDNIADLDVCGRYHYGELRLSRLNLYAPLLLRKFHYEQVYGQYGDYFARLYGPILFVFAVMATILNSMQVELAVEQVLPAHWISLWSVCRWFSTVSLIGTAVISFWVVLLWLWMFSDEWVYAIKGRLEKRRERHVPSRC